ncbi:MAG: T9SS type A sorting domain-containing protein [Ignavibacteriae bacterium]|nr:T9SS type A sorting domain-containing protein [Ignavibacteriota bacterium]
MNEGFPEYPYASSIVIHESTIFVGGAEKSVWSRSLNELTVVEDESLIIPIEYSLSQNYPNPFNPSTAIRYTIPSNEFVTLKIYNILGSEITTLVNQKQASGSYEVLFNTTDLPSGIYFYQISTSSFTQVKKMLLLK